MIRNIVQLVGLAANQGLYRVPNGIDAQECFNNVFDNVFAVDEDATLGDVDEVLEAEYGIERVWVDEVFTEKL